MDRILSPDNGFCLSSNSPRADRIHERLKREVRPTAFMDEQAQENRVIGLSEAGRDKIHAITGSAIPTLFTIGASFLAATAFHHASRLLQMPESIVNAGLSATIAAAVVSTTIFVTISYNTLRACTKNAWRAYDLLMNHSHKFGDASIGRLVSMFSGRYGLPSPKMAHDVLQSGVIDRVPNCWSTKTYAPEKLKEVAYGK